MVENEADISLQVGLAESAYDDILKEIQVIQKKLDASGVKIKLNIDVQEIIRKADEKQIEKAVGGINDQFDKVGENLANELISRFNIVDKETKKLVKKLSDDLAQLRIGEIKSGATTTEIEQPIIDLSNAVMVGANNIQKKSGIYDEFYRYLKGISAIRISSSTIKDLGADWNDRMTFASKFSTKKGTEIDSIYQEMSRKFTTLFSGTTDQSNQFREIIANIKAYRADVEKIEPISADTLGLSDSVFESIFVNLRQLEDAFKLETAANSAKDIAQESKAMEDVQEVAGKAAEKKEKFADANRDVADTAQRTEQAVEAEHDAFMDLNDINSILANVNITGNQGTNIFRQFGDTLRNAFGTYTVANLLTDAIRKIVSSGKEALEIVKDLNAAAVSLQMATNADYGTIQGMMKDYGELAKELGALTTEVAAGADTWLRQGMSADEVNQLIEQTMILSKVAKISAEDAASYITAIMKGFHVGADGVGQIIDSLTSIDLVSATSADGLTEAASRVAASADLAGISMNTLLGYEAAIGEASQESMSVIGNALKTILSRMANIKAGKLELIDEDGTTEILSDVELVLSNFGIKLRDSANEFRDFSDVLDEVAAHWSGWSNVQQSAVSEAFAGQRQSNRFKLLMENYDKAMEYAEAADNAEGTSAQKFEFYLDSLEAKTKSLQTSLMNLASSTVPEGLYGGILDITSAVINLTAESGILKGVLAGIAATGAIYTFQHLGAYLHSAAQEFSNFGEALSMTGSGVGADEMQRLIDLTGGLSQSQTRLLLSTQNLTDSQKIAVLMHQGLSQAEAEEYLRTNNLTTAQAGATASTFSLSNALRGLYSTLMANPMILITAAITLGVTAWNRYKQAQEEATRATKAAADKAKTLVGDIADLSNEYIELSLAVQDDAGAKDNLIQTQSKLIEKLGLEGESVDELIEKYGSLSAAIRQASIDTLKDAQLDLIAGLNIAKDELLKESKDKFFSANNAITATGKDAVDAFRILDNAGIVRSGSYGSGGGSWVLPGDASTIEGAVENFERLKNAMDALQDSGEFTAEELASNSLYQALYGRYNDLKEVVENYKEAVSNINNNQVQIMLIERANNLPKATEEFESFRQELVTTAQASQGFIGTEQEIAAGVDAYLATVSSFKEFYGDFSKEIEKESASIKENLKSPFTTLSEDQKSAIETYKSTLATLSDAITSSLTGLDAFDTTSLMTEFPDYDWSGYVSGAKSLNDVLDEIGEKSLETVLAQFKDLEGVEPLLDDLRKKFGEAFSFKDDITKNLGAYHELMDVLDRVTKGEVLQTDEITGLINKYGDLADAVEIVEGGYSLEEDAIKSLINTFVDSSNTYIAQEMRKTKALIEETKKRIRVLMTERKALDALSEENTPKFGYDENGKPILGATGRGINVPTLKEIADDRYAELSKYLTSLEEEYLGYEETMRELITTKSKNKSSSSDSTSDFTEQVDWAAQSISVLSREVTNLQEKFENTKGYKAQKAALDNVISAQESLKEGYQSAAKLYSNEYTKSLNTGILAQQNLSNAVKEKIESGGTWDIEDFIDKNVKSGDEGLHEQLYNAIQESIDWYNKRNDAGDNAVKVGFEINENEMKKLTLDIEHQEAVSNRLTTAQERYTDSLSKQLKYGEELHASESERYDLLIKQAKAQKNYVEAKQLELEKEKTLNEIAKDNFDKISSYYDNRISTNEAKSSKVDSQIALDEAQGRTIGSAYYERQNGIYKQNITYLEKQRDKQMESLKTIRMYTDEWYDARQALIETNDEIIKTTTSIVENNNMIRQIRWDNFDGLLGKYSELTGESDFLNDLLDAYEKIDDATGKLNENGISSNALHMFNYDTDMYQADELGREIAKLDKEFRDDPLNNDYLERRKELVDNRYDMVRSAQSEKEAVVSLIKEGIQKEIDIMADLVAKKKEALDAEKDLYDYRKSITEKQKDISKIQRQIVALEGDDSLENQKRLRELRSQLADAQGDLSDTQYDRSISDQKEALDDMLSKYREDMEAYMKDSNALFEHAIAGVNASSDESMQNIKKVAQEVGMEVSDTLAGSFRDAGDAVSSYKGTFEDASATTVRNLGGVKDKWDEATVAAEQYAIASSKALYADDQNGKKPGPGGNVGTSGNTTSATATTNKNDKKEKETQEKIAKIQDIISNASVRVGESGAGTQVNRFVLGYQDVLNGNGNKLSWEEMAKVAGVLGIKTDAATVASSSKTRSQILKALEELIGKNLKDLSGFATGGVVKSTMGKDDSLIKVKKGETVLTEKFTQLLPQTTEKMQAFIDKVRYEHENTSTGYQIGENPLAKMQKQIEKETRAVQEFISNNYNATPTITGDIHIHLDGSNVTDFKSFRENLDGSKSFIQHMVLDEMFGKGQLSYKKYKGI